MKSDSGKKYIILALAGVLFFALFNCLIIDWTLDDAFISYRYAQNLAEGNGLVFNKGEQVEGYSNFLWVYFLAFGAFLKINLVLWSKIMGTLLSISTLTLVFFSYRFHPSITKTQATFGTFALGTCGIFIPWGMSGLEVSLYSFLLTFTFLFYLSIRLHGNEFRFFILGILTAMIWLTRPEGILFIIVFFIDTFVSSFRENRKRIFYLIGSFLLVYVPYFLWRLFYFGDIFPNTFYAKVGYTWDQFFRGIAYTKAFLFSIWPFILLLITGLFSQIIIKKRKKPISYLSHQPFPLILYIFPIYMIYNTAVGGDYMPSYRFYAPLVPVIIIWAIQIYSFQTKVWVLILMIITANNLYQTFFNKEIYKMISDYKLVAHGKLSGKWLKENCPPSTVIATNTIGSVPFYSDLYAIDMLGITDRHIAHRQLDDMGRNFPGHEKGDGAYVLKRYPDIILFGGPLGSKIPVLRSDFELSRIPLFFRLYQYKTAEIQSKIVLRMYIKKSFLRKLNLIPQLQ